MNFSMFTMSLQIHSIHAQFHHWCTPLNQHTLNFHFFLLHWVTQSLSLLGKLQRTSRSMFSMQLLLVFQMATNGRRTAEMKNCNYGKQMLSLKYWGNEAMSSTSANTISICSLNSGENIASQSVHWCHRVMLNKLKFIMRNTINKKESDLLHLFLSCTCWTRLWWDYYFCSVWMMAHKNTITAWNHNVFQ